MFRLVTRFKGGSLRIISNGERSKCSRCKRNVAVASGGPPFKVTPHLLADLIELSAMEMGMAVHLLVDGFDFNPVALKKLLAIDGEAVPSIRECISSALFEIYVGMGI